MSMQSVQNIYPPHRLEGVRYHDEQRLRNYLEQGVLTWETLAGGFTAAMKRYAERPALVWLDGQITYGELDDYTDRLAAALLEAGLQPLDRALFQCGNCPELLIAFLACLKAGIIPVCALQAFREREIGYLGNLSAAKMHLVLGTDEKFDDVEFAERMKAEIPTMEITVQACGTPRGQALGVWALINSIDRETAQKRLQEVELHPFQVAVFQLSGGTTGVPKIIPRFQSEYLYNMRSVAQTQKYTQEDVLFFPTPYMHNLNMGCYFGPFLLHGATVTVAQNLQADHLQAMVRKFSPTWYGVAGPIFQRILPALQATTSEQRQKMKFVTPKNSRNIHRQVPGVYVCHIFGMTEGVIMYTRPDDPETVKNTGIGRPVSPYDEVKIVEPGTETPVADGEIGEALFRGPYTIQGYYKSEKEDKTRFTTDGFYRSEDLMRAELIDGKRHYFFCGRIKDVIDRAGEKINVEEVELAINEHPNVAFSALIGMPDPVYGERACAFVVLKDPRQDMDLEALKQWLEQQGMAKFKWPERLEIIPEMPLTASGKIGKPILRERLHQMLQQESQ